MNTNRVLTGIAVMAATIMQVLDTTIINVALPNMAGQLDATPDNISWVLTSYLIASAIIMPLTGFITDRIGQKRFLMISIAGFVITSMLCGMAASLFQMVLFRFLQGVFGAALVPLSQSIMLQIFPGEQRGKAMAIWSMGVMVAPIMGPTLGGYLTEAISWRWTFYINLPVGILSFVLAMRHVHDTPTKQRRMDWLGFATLALGIGALQLVLDRGNQDDWFTSDTIIMASLVSALSLLFFVVYTPTCPATLERQPDHDHHRHRLLRRHAAAIAVPAELPRLPHLRSRALHGAARAGLVPGDDLRGQIRGQDSAAQFHLRRHLRQYPG